MPSVKGTALENNGKRSRRESLAVTSAEQSALIEEARGQHQDTGMAAVVGEESGGVLGIDTLVD